VRAADDVINRRRFFRFTAGSLGAAAAFLLAGCRRESGDDDDGGDGNRNGDGNGNGDDDD
jgi:hypothetical protein